MDTIIKFPTAEAALKPARSPAEKWAATVAEERRRLQEDNESLRERESNLREYEARLRILQAEIEAGRTVPPIPMAKTTSDAQDTAPHRVAVRSPSSTSRVSCAAMASHQPTTAATSSASPSTSWR